MKDTETSAVVTYEGLADALFAFEGFDFRGERTMFSILALVAAALLAQQSVNGKPDETLDFMKASALSYRFVSDDDARAPLRLRDEPAFRLGRQPADNVMDGAIFLWLDDVGRPAVAAQIFAWKDEGTKWNWRHEFISLSPGTLHGERDGRASWSPRHPGVEFHAVPGAPKPAASAAARAIQMKELAREFHSSDNFKNKGSVELRLLTTPIARYGKAGSKVVDGTLFAFALGTDPEALLFLEARNGPQGLEWQYAFAPMTCFELKGTHRDKQVWSSPNRDLDRAGDPTQPYFNRAEN